ncbi:MAG TPA: PIN domain-containing protein, partial [Candidatus Nanoarchaeia archaeon]|nr:PIN domain-containing protein [Candidatus Nanoarchaeia archaeon]
LNVLRDEEKLTKGSLEFFELVESKNIEVVISVITLTELFRGAFKLQSAEKKKELDSFIHVLKARPIPVTSDPAIEAARLIENCNIRFADAIIAASMYFSGIHIFVTRNKKDFKNIELEVLTPEEFSAKYH